MNSINFIVHLHSVLAALGVPQVYKAQLILRALNTVENRQALETVKMLI